MRRALILLFVLLFQTPKLLAQAGDIAQALKNEKNKILVAAHRGDWRNFPENSLEGIQSCIDHGIDIVEIDVQQTKDGHFILMHDQTVSRTTHEKKRVSSYLLNDIVKLRLLDRNGILTNCHVPTLKSALALSKGKIIVNIDKSAGRFSELLKIIDSIDCGKGVILKGQGSQEMFYKYKSTDTTSTLFMPIISSRTPGIDTFALKSEAPLIEILLRSDSDYVCNKIFIDNMARMNCGIWYNALFNTISGGHSESSGAIDAWDWFLCHGVKVIQTDFPFELMQFLVDRGLHEIPVGFSSVNLSNLPKSSKKANADSTTKEKGGELPIDLYSPPTTPPKTAIIKKPSLEQKFYFVKAGDTISQIAQRNNISIKKLLKLNPKLKLTTILKIGLKVRIR